MRCLPKSPFSPKRMQKFKEEDTPCFMNGSSTSTTCFDLDVCDDRDFEMASRLSLGEESILASSQQNSTMDLPISAPSSIARNQVLACSTPKDLTSNKETLTGCPSIDKENCAPRKEINRNVIYRCQKMRRLTSPYNPPANYKTVYYPKEYIANLEEKRRQELSLEGQLKKKKEIAYQAKMNVLRNNLPEFIASIFLTVWYIFYTCQVIPNDFVLFQLLTLALSTVYVAKFLIPSGMWCLTVGLCFLLYGSIVWTFGLSINWTAFGSTMVFVRSLMSVIHGIIIIVE